MYLFVVYFSFAPVISASIHRYVNYFDIQVLMMVTETETLTSTLHHYIFTYLDYVFFCYLHTDGFYSYLLSYIYIYIYISVCLAESLVTHISVVVDHLDGVGRTAEAQKLNSLQCM